MYPLKFEPFLRPMIWGGEKIAAYKGVETSVRSIGESWELSGVAGHESIVAEGPCKGVSLPELIDRYGAELVGKSNYERFGNEFPLLVKFIDAREDLSIQVHPDDRLAWERHRMHGKTEMWYVVSETAVPVCVSGFDRRVDAETYAAAVADHTICDLLRDHPIAAGDVFFLPAGRVHSIGAGAFIAEIQQTSDLTYRIYDYDRPGPDGQAARTPYRAGQGGDRLHRAGRLPHALRADPQQGHGAGRLPLFHHAPLRRHVQRAVRLFGARFVRGADLRRRCGRVGRFRREPCGGAAGRDRADPRLDAAGHAVAGTRGLRFLSSYIETPEE